MRNRLLKTLLLGSVALLAAAPAVFASSHSEAFGTLKDRTIDDTDLYAWVASDAPNAVTFVGNWVPLLEPNGGPNFGGFDDNAYYYINIDNVGDAADHIYYEFKFTTSVGNGNTFLYNTGVVNSLSDASLNVKQTYTVTRYNNGVPTVLGSGLPVAPFNVGSRSMPRYGDLAAQAIRTLSDGSKVFVGPRDDPFFVDLGAVFDLLTIRKVPGDKGRGRDGVAGYNVMSVVLQVPFTRLTKDGLAPSAAKNNHILGIYDSAKRPATRVLNADGTVTVSGPLVQVSRLGMPLVNEVVIPLSQKDKFNASSPTADGQFLGYVTNPELGGLLHALYGLDVPPAPRNDLVAVFLTGVAGLNQPAGVTACEKLRLNMAIPPTAKPNRFGVIAGDLAGFPNGRRLGDDVVDIAERVVAGVLVSGFNRPLNNRLGDGVDWNDRPYLPNFPYVAPPWSGLDSPHSKLFRRHSVRDGLGLGESDEADDADDEETVDPDALEGEAAQTQRATGTIGFTGPNPGTTSGLQYTLSAPARVALKIFDLQGRSVRTLIDQDAAPGTFRTQWDGRMDDGTMAGKGVFFARLTTDGRVADTRKVVIQ